MKVTVSEFKTNLAENLRLVETGETIEITRGGHPIAKMTSAEDAMETTPAKRRGGRHPKFLPIPGLRMTSLEALRQERADRL